MTSSARGPGAPDAAAEARLFGLLARRGILPMPEVAALFDEARAAAERDEPTSLSALAVDRGLIDEARLRHLFTTDGEDVPRLRGYRYVRKVGEGGSASVFEVEREDGGREALKVLHAALAEDEAAVKAFVAEARLLERLEHPNVVKGRRVGRLEGRYLFFMEFVPGRTLQEAIEEGGAFDEDEALSVILQVARALDYLRTEGIVHRDIKPGNILVTPENDVRVIDLGFALHDAAGAGGAETTVGTAAYLSPEQARGEADLDVRSDIYSLGATLYQMVLGELPFSGDDEDLVQSAVLEGLSAQATKGGRISAHMHYFIEKMMAKDRDYRYQDPQELAADIESKIAGKKSLVLDEPSEEQEEAERLRKRLDRMRRKRTRRKR